MATTFLSASAHAFYPLWLNPMMLEDEPQWSLEQVTQQIELFDCGLEADNQHFCSDVVYYYRIPMYSEVDIENGKMSQVSLQQEYTLIRYSDLQINLRKDGFLLKEAQIGGAAFVVADILSEVSVEEANKALVMFLNRPAKDNKRTLVWQRGDHVQAVLTTDNESIKVRFHYIDN